MSESSVCFPSNPDVSGVGVRIAIYVQNLFSLFYAFQVVPADGRISQKLLNRIGMQSGSIVTTAGAVLLSTVIQASTKKLTNLHAIIILNLSWINNTNLFTYLLFYVYHRLGVLEAEAQLQQIDADGVPGREEQSGSEDPISRSASVRTVSIRAEMSAARANPILPLGTAHLVFMTIVGVWVWHRPISFGTSRPCSGSALVVILGREVPLASEGLRKFSLFIYSSMFCMHAQFLAPPALFVAHFLSSHLPVLPSTRSRIRFISVYVGLLLLLTISIVFVVDTELMLKRNSSLIEKGDADWGFGQVLALLLIRTPVHGARRRILDLLPQSWRRRNTQG